MPVEVKKKLFREEINYEVAIGAPHWVRPLHFCQIFLTFFGQRSAELVTGCNRSLGGVKYTLLRTLVSYPCTVTAGLFSRPTGRRLTHTMLPSHFPPMPAAMMFVHTFLSDKGSVFSQDQMLTKFSYRISISIYMIKKTLFCGRGVGFIGLFPLFEFCQKTSSSP